MPAKEGAGAGGEGAACGKAPTRAPRRAPSPATLGDAPRPVVCERFDGLGVGGAPARLGVMGGTFDPIHIGHLACAEQAREAYRLDAVVFVPAGTPVFKKDRDVAPAADRLAMCRLAVRENPAFDASAIEVERGGDSYTADTLRLLRAHYPESVELFFITGADAAADLPRWHEPGALARLARFVAFTRPGYELGAAQRDALAAGGFRVDYLRTTALAVSSSELRERLARGRSVRYLVPDAVCDYIRERGLYAG